MPDFETVSVGSLVHISTRWFPLIKAKIISVVTDADDPHVVLRVTARNPPDGWRFGEVVNFPFIPDTGSTYGVVVSRRTGTRDGLVTVNDVVVRP